MQNKTGIQHRPQVRTFKIALFVAVLVLLSSSCVTQRRCMQKYPPTPSDTVTVVDIVYRDTTVYVPMPADTVRDSVVIQLPCDPAPEYVSGRVKAVGKYATAEAWVVGNELKIQLTMNDVKLEFTIDSIAETRTKTVTITNTVTVKERVIAPFYRAMLFVSIVLFLLLALFIFLALRR